MLYRNLLKYRRLLILNMFKLCLILVLNRKVLKARTVNMLFMNILIVIGIVRTLLMRLMFLCLLNLIMLLLCRCRIWLICLILVLKVRILLKVLNI